MSGTAGKPAPAEPEPTAAAEPTDAGRDTVLAMLGHELRSPLGPVRNALHILRGRGSTDPQSLWALELIERQLDELVSVIESVSEVARLERGGVPLEAAPFLIAAVVADAIEAAAPALSRKRQRCTLACAATDAQAHGDRKRVLQTLRTLLRCASKALTTGEELAVAVEPGADRWTVCVGSASEPPPSRPSRDAERSRQAPVASIDLLLVRRLVALLGGDFASRGLAAGGSCYEVSFPRGRR